MAYLLERTDKGDGMDKINYIVIIWECPDYGGRDAVPYFINSQKELLKFLKNHEGLWEDTDVYEVNYRLFTGKEKNGRIE